MPPHMVNQAKLSTGGGPLKQRQRYWHKIGMEEIEGHAGDVQEAPVHDAPPSAGAKLSRKVRKSPGTGDRQRKQIARAHERPFRRKPGQVQSRKQKTRKRCAGPKDRAKETPRPGSKGDSCIKAQHCKQAEARHTGRKHCWPVAGCTLQEGPSASLESEAGAASWEPGLPQDPKRAPSRPRLWKSPSFLAGGPLPLSIEAQLLSRRSDREAQTLGNVGLHPPPCCGTARAAGPPKASKATQGPSDPGPSNSVPLQRAEGLGAPSPRLSLHLSGSRPHASGTT